MHTILLRLSFVFLFFASPIASAQEELVQRLSELNRQIEVAQSDVESVSSRLQSLESDLKDISGQITALEAEKTDTAARIVQAERERAEADTAIRAARARAAELDALSMKRIRALYLYEGQGGAWGLLNVQSGPAFSRGAYYLTKVRSFDAQMLNAIEQARAEAESRAADLARILALQTSLHDELAGQQQSLRIRSQERQRLRAELSREQAKREQLLTSIRAQALRLETVLASLTNAGDSPAESKPKSKKRKSRPSGGFSSFEGQGLAILKGQLRLPVEGARVVQSFSAGRASAASKGVTFLAAVGTAVSVVAPGKVIFVGKMPELGTVAVVDHGRRWYSLYGLVDAILVAVGDEVDRGTLIGKTLEPSRAGGNLYFEIRSAGLAVDPQPYFSKK